MRNLIDTVINIARADGDVLDAFATVFFKIGDNLPGLATVLVNRNADASAGRVVNE